MGVAFRCASARAVTERRSRGHLQWRRAGIRAASLFAAISCLSCPHHLRPLVGADVYEPLAFSGDAQAVVGVSSDFIEVCDPQTYLHQAGQLNKTQHEQLTELLKEWHSLRRARPVARAILAAREVVSDVELMKLLTESDALSELLQGADVYNVTLLEKCTDFVTEFAGQHESSVQARARRKIRSLSEAMESVSKWEADTHGFSHLVEQCEVASDEHVTKHLFIEVLRDPDVQDLCQHLAPIVFTVIGQSLGILLIGLLLIAGVGVFALLCCMICVCCRCYFL